MYKPTNIRAQTNHPHLFPPSFTVIRDQPKIGRNDPCPCGSGKKYKKCCWEKDHNKGGFSEVMSSVQESLQRLYGRKRPNGGHDDA